MHTVIIINERSAELLKNYKTLFKPFVDSDEISFCTWNESGTDIKSSVPDIYKIVKGKYEWRAVIVVGNTEAYNQNALDINEKNPFDFVSADYENAPICESNNPLVRLTHMLAGFPALGIKDFTKAYSFFDPQTGKDITVQEENVEFDCELINTNDDDSFSDITESVKVVLDDSVKYIDSRDLRITYIEENYSDEEKREHKRLQSKYSFLEDRPKEIILIATKSKTEDNDRQQVINFWKNNLETESSDFWKRNNYPNICRFLEYELSQIEQSSYTRELTCFWMAVLTVAINSVNPSSLQAYRLYKFYVEVSAQELGETLNDHLSKMVAAEIGINNRMALRPDYSFDEEEDFLSVQSVPVVFNKTDGNDLSVRDFPIGLSGDCPRDEYTAWDTVIRAKNQKFEKFMKAPRRAVDVACEFARSKSDSFIGAEYELDKFQFADLNEQMDSLEWEVISTETGRSFDKKKYKEDIDRADAEVKKQIVSRLKRKTVIIYGAIGLLLYFAGFVPYLINTWDIDFETFTTSLLPVVAAIAAVAASGVVCLFALRNKLKAAVKGLDGVMHRIAVEVNSAAAAFEVYLTNVCTYMKGQSILKGVSLRRDSAGSFKRSLHVHDVALKTAVRHEKEVCAAFGIKIEIVPMVNVSSFFDVEVAPSENKIYRLAKNNNVNDIPLNNTGDKVTAPYKFITKLFIDREELYETMKGEE